MADQSPANQTPPSTAMQSLSINSQPPPSSSSSSSSIPQLSVEERFRIIRSVGEECIQEDELLNLLIHKHEPICYDGFEPSGRMHIAQGVMKAINVNKLTSAGCRVKIWIADWFAQLNNKMGDDLKKIKIVGQYLIEIWKAVGMDLNGKVEFFWSSEEINSRASEYWPLVMDIARRNKLPRIMRCCQIMGRSSEQDELSAAQILYPCMQCADIFSLSYKTILAVSKEPLFRISSMVAIDLLLFLCSAILDYLLQAVPLLVYIADICQLGMDQRKVNVLAREYCDNIKRKNKPIILSHHMLPGLQQGQEKMFKSDPSSSIFMEDEEYIIFPCFNEFRVERNAENGGNKTFKNFEELVSDYESGELHPGDLKPALSRALNKILQPVRDHFNNDAKAKDLLKRVKSYRVTK
ncbi:hypothetical protein CRYUN_Cryun32bG0112500 [Craigia yunnanensis]